MTRALRSACLWACAATLTLALAACGQDKKPASQGTAEGEILPGSASDAMLPYDTVQSQPPLAPLPVATGKPGKKGDAEDKGAASDAAGEDGAGEEAPAPALHAEPSGSQ
jgi:hypothetical protein